MAEIPFGSELKGENGGLKDISEELNKINFNSGNSENSVEENTNNQENAGNVVGSEFKVASTNLPEKTGFWTKLKNALFYEIKIELTPHQQKIEREINDFLHQEITWKSLKEAALSEVPITFRGKRIF